jgi:hypothetical protein
MIINMVIQTDVEIFKFSTKLIKDHFTSSFYCIIQINFAEWLL